MVPKHFYLLEDNDLCQSSQCKKSPILAPMNDSINMRSINMTSNDIVTAPSSGVDHKQYHTTQHQQTSLLTSHAKKTLEVSDKTGSNRKTGFKICRFKKPVQGS